MSTTTSCLLRPVFLDGVFKAEAVSHFFALVWCFCLWTPQLDSEADLRTYAIITVHPCIVV